MQKATDKLNKLVRTDDGAFAFAGQRVDPGLVNASAFGNWVLVEAIEFKEADGPASASVNMQGLTEGRVKVVARGSSVTSSAFIDMTINGDTGASSYEEISHYGGSAHGDNQSFSSFLAVALVTDTSPSVGHSETIISRIPGQDAWTSLGQRYWYRVSNTDYVQNYGGRWMNDAPIETIDFVERNGNAANATIEVYVWQEIKPAGLHSYELVLEADLDNESFAGDVDFVDGEELKIVTSLMSTSASIYVGATVDGIGSGYLFRTDADTSPEASPMMYTANGVSSSGSIYVSEATVYMRNEHPAVVGTGLNSANFGVGYATGGEIRSYYNGTGSFEKLNIVLSGTATGSIKVYRKVESHLLTSNPGLLEGMALKSTSATDVEVAAGTIEIGGTICHNRAPITVSLAANLASGETISDDTLYYAYAVKGAGTAMNVVFSATEPLMDRFGNVAASKADADVTKALYHPSHGTTWRYIGQVRTADATGAIVEFVECRPGKWVSTMEPCTKNATNIRRHGALRPDPVRYIATNGTDTSYGPDYLYNSGLTSSYGLLQSGVTDSVVGTYIGEFAVRKVDGTWDSAENCSYSVIILS